MNQRDNLANFKYSKVIFQATSKIKLTDNQYNYQINKNIYKNIWSYQKKAVTLHPQMRVKPHTQPSGIFAISESRKIFKAFD